MIDRLYSKKLCENNLAKKKKKKLCENDMCQQNMNRCGANVDVDTLVKSS